jgi:hypothetical protein
MFKSSKKLLLLACAMTALCASAVPSMASAASWGTVGSTHTITGRSFGIHIFWPITARIGCSDSHKHSTVLSAAVMTITSASFSNCAGEGAIATCNVTMQATSLPWSATGPSTSNVTIDGVRLDILFENKPGTSCPIASASATLTGNLQSGAWDAAAHQVTYNNATGLVAHSAALGSASAAVSATLQDLTQTLTLS